MFELNTVELKEALIADLRCGNVPMVTASPGVGKSDVVRSIANDFKLKLLDVRVSLHEPVDFQGYPESDGQKMQFKPAAFLPLEGIDEPPEGYAGWLLFLDEFNSGNKQTEAACYKLILDRMVGQEKLHPKCAVVAAGNLSTDRAIVNTLSTATTSRFSHYRLAVDHRLWIDWANANDIDHRIISFIKFKPEILHKFDPNTSEMTFPCPRTWFFASRTIKDKDPVEKITKARLAGTIGEGAAVEFSTFSQIYQSLPTIEQIMADPKKGWKVPTEPSEQYAITTMLAHNINQNNVDNIMTATERLPIEFQVITLKDIFKRAPELKKHDTIRAWIGNNAAEIYD